jgi:hypothetical protein
MLTSKKELEKINQSITNLWSIKNEINEHNQQQFLNSNNLINNVSDKINQLENTNITLTKNFENEVARTVELNGLLKKRIDSFKLFEDSARKKIMEDVKFEIQKQLQSMFETTNKYKVLENNLLVLNKKIDNLSSEIIKFNVISAQIKSADFDLTHFVKQVTAQDQEKLRLMRENEKLKMLIANKRSRNY